MQILASDTETTSPFFGKKICKNDVIILEDKPSTDTQKDGLICFTVIPNGNNEELLYLKELFSDNFCILKQTFINGEFQIRKLEEHDELLSAIKIYRQAKI